jgi:eukaryotic-like serine/threonine-protein kinase
MAEFPSRIGPYEILEPLGAGGMGHVYRARDTRLQRHVAIKLLPEAARFDPNRQRRFAQEAVAASALNHPNILIVYDVGADESPYLVSELIEGESLRSEMNRGRIALKRVIEITHQIAEGLAAAHDAGIVHRDLKPQNVMVTRDGRVKIVDFGLAKTQEDDASLVAQTDTQTASGLIIGTVPYMSPEQARGGKADFRSDQFALGVMLYELTTATHPFKRETAVQTLSAIIAEEPPDPAQVSPTLPVAVRWLIHRLLAKNPRDRFAHTADLAADLRTIRDFLSEATASAVVTPLAGRWSKWRLRAALLALLVANVLLLRVLMREDTPRFEKFTPLATDAGYQGEPAWAPDGKSIAYSAEIDGVVQIFTRTLASATRTKVTSSAFDCFSPVWSTDGFIYYHSLARDKEALWRVSPAGGAPEVVIENASDSHISPDGKTVAFFRDETGTRGFSVTLWIASPLDAEPRRFARGPFAEKSSSGRVRFSPDGSKLMVWVGDEPSSTGFWEIPLPNGEPRQRLPAFTAGAGQGLPLFSWLPDNRHIVVTRSDGVTTGTHLWLADTRTDDIVPMTTTPGNEGAPSVSPDGRTVAFTAEATDFDLVEVPLDGAPVRPFLSSTRNEFDPAASPVSTQYAFVTDRTGNLQIWLQNEEGYLQEALVTEAAFEGERSMAVGSLAFSPDGKRLAFQRAGEGPDHARPAGSRIWVTSISGGTPVPFGGDETYYDAPTWSPDGEWIAYLSPSEGNVGLVKARVGGRSAPVVLLKSGVPAFVTRPQWSPDGKWILCETFDGLTQIAADGSRSQVISDPGWLAFAWEQDSRRIYGLRATDDQHHFMLVTLDSQTGVQRVINENLGTIPQALQPIRGFSRLRGRGFLTSIARVRSDIYLIDGFRLPASRWQRFWPLAKAR